MGKSIDVMDCFIGALLDNKQINVSLIDLVWENSIDACATFGTHCVCVCGGVCVDDINVQECKIVYYLS